jgi:hypothetical protein
LAFWPMPNLFYRPRLRINGFDDVFAGRYEHEPAPAAGGNIGEASCSTDGLTISVDGGFAHLSELVDARGQPIDLQALGQKPNLMPPPTAKHFRLAR